MIIENEIKFRTNIEKELINLQDKINSSKSHMERCGLLLRKVRLLRLQELKKLAKGIDYKKVVEDLNNYMRGKEND